MKTIIIAGGCFWGVEAYFKLVDGVEDTTVGYIAGQKAHPTYQEVCYGSGHAEAVWIQYDETVVSLDKLLDHFFNIVDPTLVNRQGPDIGVQYRTGIYNYDKEDEKVIKAFLASKQKDYQRPIVIELIPSSPFYEAEEEHQDYLDKHENGYCHVNLASVKNIK